MKRSRNLGQADGLVNQCTPQRPGLCRQQRRILGEHPYRETDCHLESHVCL